MLRAVLLEDEPPTRARMRRLLATHADALALVAEADDAAGAYEVITRLRPDVLLLDVQLPGADGFALLERLRAGGAAIPHVVFVTAYASYAVQAFEAEAVDFLVKPVEPERLAATIARLHARSAPPFSADTLARLAHALRPRPAPVALPVREASGFAFVPLAELVWLEATEKVVLAHATSGRPRVVDASLAALAARLPEAFVQVSRAAIVHTAHLRALRRAGAGRYVLTLSTGDRVTSGPTFADAVAQLGAF